MGIKLYLVSIGSAERGQEFAKLTGFPEDRLLADPDSQTYAAMGWYNSISKTFFSIQVPSLISPYPTSLCTFGA